MSGQQNDHAVRLNSLQEEALRHLIRKLTEKRIELGRLDALTMSLQRSEEFSNVFGIFGPRGAGKSTILSRLYREYRETKLLETKDFESLLLIEPLDCTASPAGIDPGMAILLHMDPFSETVAKRNRATHSAERLGELGRNLKLEELGSKLKELDRELNEIVSTYTHLSKHHVELRLELASSPKHFADSLVKDVKSRFGLAKSLAEWLDKIAETAKYQAVVILLDDFDLASADDVRRWFHCLLDELHQARLFFILTGDFHRLEHLIIDPDAETDDKTGRALLHKIVPWQNRIMLERWLYQSRREFVLHYGRQRLSLEELLKETLKPWCDFHPLLFHLLPSWPRGLVNLSDSLAAQESGSTKPPESLRDFLDLLATCRNEPLLARQIEEHELLDWEELLQFTQRSLTPEDWRETLKAARQRALPDVDAKLDPLRGLQPLSPWPLDPAMRRAPAVAAPRGPSDREQSRRLVDRARDPSTSPLLLVDLSAHDPSWPDPLRHEELWVAPLRDAEEASQPFWAELLLDLSFADRSEESSGRPLRNRMSFLENWFPARTRLGRAQLEVESSFKRIREFFDDYADLSLKSILYWITWESDRKKLTVQAKIGWSPLLAALRRERSPYLAEEIAALDLDIRSIQGKTQEPSPSAEAALNVLPDRLWAMLFLVDALDRCPWTVFSARIGWHLATYLALAGAFFHGAYLYAMVNAGKLGTDALKDPQQRIVNALKHRDPSYILGTSEQEWYEERVFDRLKQILRCELPASESNPLQRAAASFFQLEPYQALVKLVEQGLLF